MPTKTIAPEIREILQRGTLEGDTYRLPEGQLDRPTYEACNKVLTGLGATWDKRARAHVAGDHSALDRLTEVLETGKRVDLKQETQFFATPAAIVSRIIVLAELRRGLTVLEPSAGTGALAFPASSAVGSKGLVSFCETHLPFYHRLVADGFVPLGSDFLAVDPARARTLFDRVVMNPPFTRGADVKHVSHAFGFLKPGGRLVSVMSPSWRYRQDRASDAFRSLVDRCGTVADVPAGAFRESGTDVATCVVTLWRDA